MSTIAPQVGDSVVYQFSDDPIKNPAFENQKTRTITQVTLHSPRNSQSTLHVEVISLDGKRLAPAQVQPLALTATERNRAAAVRKALAASDVVRGARPYAGKLPLISADQARIIFWDPSGPGRWKYVDLKGVSSAADQALMGAIMEYNEVLRMDFPNSHGIVPDGITD